MYASPEAIAVQPCAVCKLQVPTAVLRFRQNIGMVVMRKTATMSGHLCRRCSRAYFSNFTLSTLLLGWWGYISLFVTPFDVISNVWQFMKSQKLPDPSETSAYAMLPPDHRVPIIGPSTKFKLVYGVVVYGAIFLFVYTTLHGS